MRHRRHNGEETGGNVDADGDDEEILEPFVGRGQVFGDPERGHVYFYLNNTEITIKHITRLYRVFHTLEARQNLEGASWQTITLHINSAGGDLSAGLAAYDYLRSNVEPFDVVIEGQCGSCATFIALAGQRRAISVGASVIMHQMSHGVEGRYADIRDCAANSRDEMARMRAIYAYHLTISVDEIDIILNNERNLMPAEVEKCGFATLVNVPDQKMLSLDPADGGGGSSIET
jgi:ATP-dependent protease ClpP protease subunit